MPTIIRRRQRRPVLFLIFVGVLFVACMVLEVVDPAPMDIEAATIASP